MDHIGRSLLGSAKKIEHDPGPEGESGEGEAALVMIFLTIALAGGLLVYGARRSEREAPSRIRDRASLVACLAPERTRSRARRAERRASARRPARRPPRRVKRRRPRRRTRRIFEVVSRATLTRFRFSRPPRSPRSRARREIHQEVRGERQVLHGRLRRRRQARRGPRVRGRRRSRQVRRREGDGSFHHE